jgi:hypothetical protein
MFFGLLFFVIQMFCFCFLKMSVSTCINCMILVIMPRVNKMNLS